VVIDEITETVNTENQKRRHELYLSDVLPLFLESQKGKKGEPWVERKAEIDKEFGR